jgi:pimeloyl-ACP methyl ester carboxylesterase
MNLFFKSFGQGPPLIILHGLFGSCDNWLSHAKEFAHHFTVYIVDQRNHGHSAHSAVMNYDAMAEDLEQLIANENLRDVYLIGHSMGGKTILRFAQTHAFLIEKMIVADMGIKAYPPHHDIIFKGLFAVDAANCENRKVAEERLKDYVQDESTRQFLLKNLYWKEPGKLDWRFNLPVLHQSIHTIIDAIPNERVTVPTLFIRGELSNYILPTDMDAIKETVPKATFVTIEAAGHWVHAEQPDSFRNEVMKYLL